MTTLATFLGLTARDTALLVIAAPFWLVGGFFAVMNWIVLRFNTLQERKNQQDRSSFGPSIGFFLVIGCLVFPPFRIHALWVWLLDPSSWAFIVCFPFLITQILPRRR